MVEATGELVMFTDEELKLISEMNKYGTMGRAFLSRINPELFTKYEKYVENYSTLSKEYF